jgi:hypothetical protein
LARLLERGGGDREFNNRNAVEHGFRLVNLLGTYADDEWVVMAVNSWQAEDAQSTLRVPCGANTVELPLDGRHTGIFMVKVDRVTER